VIISFVDRRERIHKGAEWSAFITFALVVIGAIQKNGGKTCRIRSGFSKPHSGFGESRMQTQTAAPAKYFVRFISSSLVGAIISLLLLVAISVLAFFVGALTQQPFELSLGSLLLFKVELEQGQLGVVMGVGLLFVSLGMGLLNALVREVLLKKLHY